EAEPDRKLLSCLKVSCQMSRDTDFGFRNWFACTRLAAALSTEAASASTRVCCFSSGFQVRIVEVHQHLASVYVLAYVDKTLAYLATDLEGLGGSLTGARDAGKSQPGLLRARLYSYRAHRD